MIQMRMRVCLAINLKKRLKVKYIYNSVLRIQSMWRMRKAILLRKNLTQKFTNLHKLVRKIVLKSHFAKLCYKTFYGTTGSNLTKSYLKFGTIYKTSLKRSGSSEPLNTQSKYPIQRAKSHRYAGAYIEEIDFESEITEQKVDDDDDEDSDNEAGSVEQGQGQGKNDNEIKESYNKF